MALISYIWGDCPSCGAKNSFGNVAVRQSSVVQGCMHCRHQSELWLPEIQKKVIYLDQFFFSSALRGEDPRFNAAAERIKRMCHLQLLLAPYSSVHEDETHQWRGHDGMTKEQLMDFIKTTSRGAEFKKDYKIEQTQVLKAWRAFLEQKEPEYVLEQRDAIRGELDRWDDYFHIDVGGYNRDIELKRAIKNETTDALLNVLESWRESSQSFDEAVALEIRDAGRQYVSTYLKMIQRYAEGDMQAAFDSPIIAKIVESMMRWLPKEQPFKERIEQCFEFFNSQYFSHIPNEWLSSHIYATIRDTVKHGAFSNREKARSALSGISDDIKHVSFFAPYCDAIVIDKFMANVVCRPTVDLPNRYGVRVFSLNNWEELLDWLNNLEQNMSDEHRAGVERAYPA
jgi:hypothetical protein